MERPSLDSFRVPKNGPKKWSQKVASEIDNLSFGASGRTLFWDQIPFPKRDRNCYPQWPLNGKKMDTLEATIPRAFACSKGVSMCNFGRMAPRRTPQRPRQQQTHLCTIRAAGRRASGSVPFRTDSYCQYTSVAEGATPWPTFSCATRSRAVASARNFLARATASRHSCVSGAKACLNVSIGVCKTKSSTMRPGSMELGDAAAAQCCNIRTLSSRFWSLSRYTAMVAFCPAGPKPPEASRFLLCRLLCKAFLICSWFIRKASCNWNTSSDIWEMTAHGDEGSTFLSLNSLNQRNAQNALVPVSAVTHAQKLKTQQKSTRTSPELGWVQPQNQ